MKRMLWSLIAVFLTLVPAAAFAAQGYTVATVNLLAGPDPQYPLIYTLDAGTPVDVQGCTDGWQWCDVMAVGSRGWVAGPYIEYLYNNQPVIVTDYGARIGIPIVTFAISAYWGRYYVNRPFYRDRVRWYGRPVPIRPYPGPRPPVRPMPRPPHGGNRPPGPGNRPPPKPGSGGNGGNYPPPGSGGHGGNYAPPSGGNRPTPPPSGGQGGNVGPRPGNGQQGGNNDRRPQGNRPAPQPRNPPPQGNNGNNNGD
ncbi:SH3 domain-containing protein [Dyella nitratireducens]|uniref:SH3b domain-containing protein n=1 Tax=Dyella nitratireducens TaxID=1849580 RepID=A0ABQ1GL48_9GAMM|nr:SH3 domain-containing protein [Dyella nitratireducens]GGA45365.1 hypothetical protein GCM10010981_38070 [Dyella nitratireducens]GLQ41309.1 hypothetical protein GCM10007902_11590 [Dyella nitratireducens]